MFHIPVKSIWLALTLLPLVVKAVVTEAILGRAGAPAPGGAAGGHPGHMTVSYYSDTHTGDMSLL